jgi:hypothetical protein
MSKLIDASVLLHINKNSPFLSGYKEIHNIDNEYLEFITQLIIKFNNKNEMIRIRNLQEFLVYNEYIN